jgi:adenylate cyclase
LEQGISLYNPQLHSFHAFLYGQDPGVFVRSQMAWALGRLGYPDQMLKKNEDALALARELGHSWSLAFALHYTVLTHQFRREGQAALQRAEELMEFAHEQGFPFWLALATITHGFELVRSGAADEGIRQMRQGMAAHRALGADIASTYWLGLLAEGYLKMGQIEEGLTVLAEALVIGEKNGERVWESELYRLKGELTLKQFGVQSQNKSRQVKTGRGKSTVTNPQSLTPNPQLEAETCFLKAIEVARQQNAKSFELRAAVSLSRLWQQQGKEDQARQLLAEVYHWFTEGFDTKDLQEAKALLTQLS